MANQPCDKFQSSLTTQQTWTHDPSPEAEVRRLRAELGRARREMAVLHAAAGILNESRNLDTVLHGVIEQITELFQFRAIRIYLYDRHKRRHALQASFSDPPRSWSKVRSFKLGEGNVGRAAHSGRAVLFEDIQSDPEYVKHSRTRKARKGGFRFFGAFPIKSRLQTIGAIVCVDNVPRRLRASEVQVMTTVAHQLGVAYENLGLLENTRAKADELSALYSISTIINESLDLDLVLTNVMHRVMEIFGAAAARLYLVDEEANALRLAMSEGLPPSFVLPDSYRLGEGVTGKVFESGKPFFFSDAVKSRKFGQLSSMRIGLKETYRRQFYIPINVKRRTVGVMNFLTPAPSRFTAIEIQMIRTIANHLGMAFENLSLFRKFTRQSRELTSLIRINRDIAGLLDRDTLLPRIVEEAKAVLRVEFAHCRLIEGNELVVAATSHPVLSRLKPRLRLGESLSGMVAREKRVVALRNALLHPGIIERHAELSRDMGWHAYLGIPMVIGNRVIGILCFASTTERDFSPQEIESIESFAAQAAIAVENAKLFGDIRDKVAELESLNRELREANRIKSDFVAAVSHELRTPLSAIIGYTSLLQDGYGGVVNTAQQEVLETVRHNADALLKLINNVLTLARAEARKIPVEVDRASLRDTLYHVRMYTEHLDQKKEVRVLWDVEENLPPVITDHGKLEEILQNLIGNAYKFTPEGHIAITVRNLEEERRIQFSISDTGIGIAEANLEKAFEKFHQGPNAHLGTHGGMGLGLSIVKEFLDLLEGTIHVESTPGKGSTFRFTIPHTIQT